MLSTSKMPLIDSLYTCISAVRQKILLLGQKLNSTRTSSLGLGLAESEA